MVVADTSSVRAGLQSLLFNPHSSNAVVPFQHATADSGIVVPKPIPTWARASKYVHCTVPALPGETDAGSGLVNVEVRMGAKPSETDNTTGSSSATANMPYATRARALPRMRVAGSSAI